MREKAACGKAASETEKIIQQLGASLCFCCHKNLPAPEAPGKLAFCARWLQKVLDE